MANRGLLSSLAERDRKCRTRGSSKPPVKRKLVQGGSSSRATRQKTSPSKSNSPFLTIFNNEEGLPDLDAKLLNLYDCCYARQEVVDNVVNCRARELLNVVEQMKGECDVLKEREKARDKECEDLKAKCEAAMADFDNNPTINVLREKIFSLSGEVASLEAEKAKLEATEASLREEVESVRRDRAEVVLKVVPYVAMKLVQSDKIGRLVAELVSSDIFYGRCHAF
ncbi:hypothetical protein Tco_0585627 [Tanacetum coccineum]